MKFVFTFVYQIIKRFAGGAGISKCRAFFYAPNMNYREYYEQQTNRKLPYDWDVHHIDFDSLNNEIENLLALPNWLHKKYHSILKKEHHGLTHEFNTKLVLDPVGINYQIIHAYTKLQDVIYECFYFLMFKEYLLGRPSIHFEKPLY